MADAGARNPHDDDEELKRRVLKNLDVLDHSSKLEVLILSEKLSSRARTEAESKRDTRAALLEYAGTIPDEDLNRISEAIEEGCEKVDEEGW